MARYPQPFEILNTFKPKRGALHLGNFASMAALPEKQSFVDVVSKMKTDAQARLGEYPGAPHSPAIPLTTLAMAMTVSKLVNDVMPKAWEIAHDAPWTSGRDASLDRAVKRWNEARFRFMSRAFKTFGKTWAQAENLSITNPGIDQLKLATTPLNYEEAALFWDEAGRISIHIKVLLDRPFESKWAVLWDSIGVDINWAIEFFAGIVKDIVKYGVKLTLALLAAVPAGVAAGLWESIGTVLMLGGLGLGGWYAWSRWGRKRRA